MEVPELKHITKQYPGVTTLDNMLISFKKGDVHALIGENGAGKSTFIKTIAGAIQPTSDEICIKRRFQLIKEFWPGACAGNSAGPQSSLQYFT